MKKAQILGFGGVLLVSSTLAFVTGRMMGRADTEKTISANASPEQGTQYSRTSRRDGGSASLDKPRKGSRTHKDIKATMSHLVAQLERSPIMNMDFDSIFQIWEIARHFSEDEVRDALTHIDGISNMQIKMTLQMMLMNRWGKINGPAAMEHAMAEENNQTRMMQLMGTLMSWTKEDPNAAFSWFEKNKDMRGSGIYNNALQGMFYQALAKHDLKRALAQIKGMENAQKKQTALTSIAQGVADDPEKLESFLKFLDDKEPDTKTMIMGSVIRQLAMSSPESAKKYVNQIKDPQEKSEMVKSLVLSMSYSDPQSGLNWGIENTPDKKAQAQMVEQNLPNWVAQDPRGAMEWYDKQPSHLKNDNIVKQSALQSAASGQHKDAYAWIERGENEQTMLDAKKSTYLLWAKASPDQAKAWAENEGREMMSGIDLDALAKEAQSTPTGPIPKHHTESIELGQ